jgi:farnesyl diphosphate synthase
MSSDKAARRAKFEDAFNVIRDELIAHAKTEGLPAEAIEWYRQNLDYNCPGGKLNRGISVVDTVEILKGRPLSDEEYLKAAILGWCVELLQAFFLVSDDIMDSSITRRGQPCWYLSPSPQVTAPTASSANYKHPDVGMIAINDSFMLEAAIYHLLKSHFRDQSYYVDLLELFHDITYKTEMGQLVDLITAPEGVVDLGRFSLERSVYLIWICHHHHKVSYLSTIHSSMSTFCF